MKPKSATWLIGEMDSLSKKTDKPLNGFKRAGILDAVKPEE